jgi:hypothetical protein
MNEPNYVGWLAPLASAPGLYRALYTRGYAAIKSVDPSAQVLIGETSPYALRRRAIAPLAFLKAVLRAGPLRADGYAHHPYDFRHPVTYWYPGADNATLATLGRLTSLLTTLGRQHRLQTPGGRPLDVYVTEWGYMSPNAKYGMDDRKRARYIAKGYQMALANPRVREMLQFLLIDPGRQYRFFDMSIVSRKGKVSNTYSALKKWAQNKARICQIATPSPC